MEYENCPQGNVSNNMLMYAAVVLLALFIIYYFSQMKQHAVGVRDGNWVNGVFVTDKVRTRPKW